MPVLAKFYHFQYYLAWTCLHQSLRLQLPALSLWLYALPTNLLLTLSYLPFCAIG
nr:MAG TPA: hypothetical protein [Caudoviricetes sp.]DAW69913.1 MAG TPA: hypothetical protein [Caudoviricetes sp.]